MLRRNGFGKRKKPQIDRLDTVDLLGREGAGRAPSHEGRRLLHSVKAKASTEFKID